MKFIGSLIALAVPLVFLAYAKFNLGSDCNIKGNVSGKSGERIYHVPGGKYYDSAMINPLNGERWFCTETEAMAEGWRRSKR